MVLRIAPRIVRRIAPRMVRRIVPRIVPRMVRRMVRRIVPRMVRQIVRCCCCATCLAGIARTTAYDVNVPFMQLERHGWDIHAV
jgi:hypothetical protein